MNALLNIVKMPYNVGIYSSLWQDTCVYDGNEDVEIPDNVVICPRPSRM